MPVVAAAVCPHPPLLVPEVASGAAPELDDLRAACLAAVDALATATTILVIGAATPPPATGASALPHSYDAAAGGSFGAYGAPGVRFGSGPPVLPLSLAIGGWLLEQTKAARLPRTYRAVPPDTAPSECVHLGREIADGNDRVGLLVMGDGSARRSEHSPVHLHPRAEIFDTTVANALHHRDLDVLKALDPDLATELQAAGRAPWQVLAGALEGTSLSGDLTYEAAPYGVGYFVASFA
ncbi:class III extradiol dioxygenase subunit B-like domain-containing protein [Kribbella sp. NPDC055110]